MDALLAYTDSNTVLAESLKEKDRELDAAHKQVVAQLSSRIENPGCRTENLLHLIFVSRSLERIGDLAVNIAEDAVFLTDARTIRHDYRKSQKPDQPT
jgi:phosphate transport system protein